MPGVMSLCRLVLQDSQGSAQLVELEHSRSVPLHLELTDRLAIHWQHKLQGAGHDALPGKLQILDLSHKSGAQDGGRAFGDELIPAKIGASPARMASQTRRNPLIQTSADPEGVSQSDAALCSQWDAWLLLAANGQDPVQLYAVNPIGIKGPAVRHVATQAGPPGNTAAAFGEDYAVFRAGDGTLSSVPLVACQACSHVSFTHLVSDVLGLQGHETFLTLGQHNAQGQAALTLHLLQSQMNFRPEVQRQLSCE